MKHTEVHDRLGPYLAGELSLQQRALVDAHLDGCEVCAEELRELRGTIDLLQGLRDEEPPEGLAERVMERIRRGEAEPTLLGRALDALDATFRPRVLAPALAGALGVLAIVALQPRTAIVSGSTPRTSVTVLTPAPPRGEIAVQPLEGRASTPLRPPQRIELDLPTDFFPPLGLVGASSPDALDSEPASTEPRVTAPPDAFGPGIHGLPGASPDSREWREHRSRMTLLEREAWLRSVAEGADAGFAGFLPAPPRPAPSPRPGLTSVGYETDEPAPQR